MKYNPASIADRTALATALRLMLRNAGFQKIESVGEEVYSYECHPQISILVYTTIVGDAVRGDGADAIRVAGVYTRKDGQTRGLVSDTRVNRTGNLLDIVERTRERMRNVFTELRTRHRQGKTCPKCGAPLFRSKGGNDVCAETCWVTK